MIYVKVYVMFHAPIRVNGSSRLSAHWIFLGNEVSSFSQWGIQPEFVATAGYALCLAVFAINGEWA